MALSELKAIEKKLRELRAEQTRLEADNFRDQLIPTINAHIGKTFAYRRNCYSCPSEPSDYWDVFRRLVKVNFGDLHAWAIYQEVQIDSGGVPQITLKIDLVRDVFPKLESGWKPCASTEFEAAYARAIQEFNTQKLCAEHIESGY